MMAFPSPKVLIPVLLIFALVGGGAYYYFQRGMPEEAQPPAEKPPAEPSPAIIEGSLSFPSQFWPSDLTMCAEDTSTKKQYCTTDLIEDMKYDFRMGYKIEVPAGSYLVFAYLPSGSGGYSKDYRAYYSEFVTCGLSVDCVSHKPIVVTVKVGETVTGIDPQDWYVF